MTSSTGGKEGSLILVVDDDPTLRDVVCHILTKAGFRTIQAKNGDEAMQLYESGRLIALITDYSMPKLDGEQLVHQIRAVDPALPILMITGEAPDLTILNLIKYKRFVALHKPFDTKTLLGALDQVTKMPMGEDGSERRKAYRLETSLVATLGSYGEVQLINISLDGCFVATSLKIPMGTEVTVGIPQLKGMMLPGKIMWLKAADNHQKTPAGVGIQFVSLLQANHTTIKNYIMKEIKSRGVGFAN